MKNSWGNFLVLCTYSLAILYELLIAKRLKYYEFSVNLQFVIIVI